MLAATPRGFKTTKSSVPRTETEREYFTGAIKINSGSYQVSKCESNRGNQSFQADKEMAFFPLDPRMQLRVGLGWGGGVAACCYYAWP